MDILKMLADLRTERLQIEEAIATIERLASGARGKRRGRPPKWMSAAKPATDSNPTSTRTMSAATRKRMAESQKKRWAAKKAAEGKS